MRPGVARIARDNLEVNGLEDIGTIDDRAVSKADGTLEFRAALRHRGGGTIKVQATTLDRFLSSYDRKIDFLKIDAEGAEADIVRGGQRIFSDPSYPITVMIEFAPAFVRKAGADPALQLRELAETGFTFSRVDERRRRLIPTDGAELLAREFSDVVMVRR